MKSFKRLLIITGALIPLMASAQQKPINELKWNLTEDGARYFKVTLFNQVWMRNTQMDPGSKVNGYGVGNFYDIGIRRFRMQAFGQLSEKVFFYSQFGMNNFTGNSPRFSGFFIHDAVAEYKVHKDAISIGSGLTGWSGLSRYASPAIATVMTLDVPLYQQATNSTTDQFLRKLSIYAKGKISKLDYRIAVSNPMNAANGIPNMTKIDTSMATFSPHYPHMQTQGYFKWEFFDKESNLNPYLPGCYLGAKKVFNIGAGFINQAAAMRQKPTSVSDTSNFVPMSLWNADVYLDLPLNKDRGDAITFYGAYSVYQMGKNHLRMVGVMNPTQTANAGNAFAMIGTGNTVYAQAGYLLSKKLIPGQARIQVFGAAQYSKFEAKKDPMLMAEAGLNYFITGNHNSKISFECQNRPVYVGQNVAERKNMFVIQFQAGI